MSEWAARRFWSEVDVAPAGAGYLVTLDGRRVMTPGKRPLFLPTKVMARRVAAEWEAVEATVDPVRMPWTRSANSAVERVAPQIEAVAAHLADYARTDLLSYRAEKPEELVLRQAETWDPLLDWAAATHGGRLRVTRGVMPIEQDADAIEALAAAAGDLDAFQLTGFHDLVTLGGSYVVSLYLLTHPEAVDEMWQATRIDHDWQAEQWGHDEDAAAEAEIKRQAFRHAAAFLGASREM